MKSLNILFIFIVTMLCSDLCAGLYWPLLKGLKKTLIYNSYAPSYGYSAGYAAGYSSPAFGNYYSGARPSYTSRQRSGSKRSGRTYSDIARVINPNPYAFVGSRPYPAQPFYPQG